MKPAFLAEFGRRAALRTQCPNRHAGSSPAERTIEASSNGRTPRFERGNPGSSPGASTISTGHINSGARVLACRARSRGFDSRMWRQYQPLITEGGVTMSPHLLALDAAGAPHRWINARAAALYYATNMVTKENGRHENEQRGGTQRATGLRSVIRASSI